MTDCRTLPSPQPGTLQVEVEPHRDRVLVCPAGELDLATADALERRILGLLNDGFDRVVINLRAVTFMDSRGIRCLVQAHQHARDAGKALSVILGGPATRRVLEVSGILNHLQLEHGEGDGGIPGPESTRDDSPTMARRDGGL